MAKSHAGRVTRKEANSSLGQRLGLESGKESELKGIAAIPFWRSKAFWYSALYICFRVVCISVVVLLALALWPLWLLALVFRGNRGGAGGTSGSDHKLAAIAGLTWYKLDKIERAIGESKK